MFESSTTSSKKQAQLAADYLALPPLDQQLIQVLSVAYEPINRSAILTCLNRQAAADSDYKTWDSKILKQHLEGLLDQGIVLQERGQGPQCHPLLAEIATRDVLEMGKFETLAPIIQGAVPVYEPWGSGPRSFRSEAQFLREARIGFYSQDLKFLTEQLSDYQKVFRRQDPLSLDDVITIICNNPFDEDWIQTLPTDFYELALTSILSNSILDLSASEAAFEVLQEDFANQKTRCSDYLKVVLAEQLLLRSYVEEVSSVLESIDEKNQDNAAPYWGWLAFLQGDMDQSIDLFTSALTKLRKTKRKRSYYFTSISGLFFILALLQEGSSERLIQAQGYVQHMVRKSGHWLRTTYSWLDSLIQIQQGNLSTKKPLLQASLNPYEGHHSFDILFGALCQYWVDAEKAKKWLPSILNPLCRQATQSGYHWFAMEAAELMAKLETEEAENLYQAQAQLLRQGSGIQPLVDIVRSQEPWELCLNALAHLQPEAPVVQAELRLAWFITLYGQTWLLQPKEQKMTAKGGWSKGRPIALKRLYGKPGEFNYLTAQDLRVCSQLETYSSYGSYGYYNKTEYRFSEEAIVELIGHPLVFWEDAPTTRVDVVKGEPELLIQKQKGDKLALTFSPALKASQTLVVTKETPTRLKIIDIKPEHRQIANILGEKNRLTVPGRAKEQVLAAIGAVSSLVTVHSDIGGGVASATEVPAQALPHVHLLPAGEGLKVAVLSRPFAEGGPYYPPGSGGETVIAEIEDQRLQTTRNLVEERQLAKAAIAACPTLAKLTPQDHEWLVEDPEACLELLLELQDLKESAVLEWPEGEKLSVRHQADLGQLQLQIKRQRDWFAATGELKLSDDLVLDMQALLALLEQTPSRFIPIGEGQFIALTQEFRKRLDDLRAYSEQQGKGLRFHPLTTMTLEDMVEDVGKLKVDKHWKAHVQKLKDVQALQPQLPTTLQAELRDYQQEGFEWLARLSHWGVGACLADDMGLGKTLQALAVMLTRAPEGPALVIAPTSVGLNWISEAQRFAPTLRPLQFGTSQRQELLDQLQPFDLLVCSYGLLQQEEVAQMLAQVKWQMIVLDEAQAIKNMTTKRSQAAMNLQAEFKLLTTGTPIENHLGELWNLFRFINPGLLGSMERFNQQFAAPIEKSQDSQARQRLKKLIQPFLLRRTKSQVLEELPSRTEITLQVELSEEEMALYEALRRKAIANLADSDAQAGAKHLQVLAEIMKLRRTCCNAQLVMPESPPASAKLQLFGEVLEELLANHHKALVFRACFESLSSNICNVSKC